MKICYNIFIVTRRVNTNTFRYRLRPSNNGFCQNSMSPTSDWHVTIEQLSEK